ncbi:ribose transport system ATP-binding protein [Kribbella amoyensis]|uniref:Ribose transport system ATP-binding protein n=1 Tax=Kribbella amoyensis TaxID=996641 RepID=A0A561B8A4_9ACTN|nr:sugar ABC transporter ATP-binding protein [Kribbella amoyensis]TWD75196.1 ribose transport system ATP-binding protein [Kribbella amoyensis]
MTEPLLELTDVTKTFPNGTRALRGVSLRVAPGTVHGLVGANGAGKSTLIKVIAGVHPPTTGTLTWRGIGRTWRDPGAARRAGLATIHQHIPLVPALSVLENVFLDRGGFRRTPAGRRAEFADLVDRLGYPVDPDALVGDLPIGARQMVAILQALAAGAELVVMDEPTASLSEGERRIVFDAVRRLSGQGTAFLYISHFLDEILELTGHVTVLRDGRVVLDDPTAAVDEEILVRSISGRELQAAEAVPALVPERSAPVRLDVAGLSSPGRLADVSFQVQAGEVLGLAGLLGSGRSEILAAVFGDDPAATGTIRVEDRRIHAHRRGFGGDRGPRDAVAAGIAYVPEDRVRQGLHVDLPLWQNVSLPYLASYSRGGAVPRVDSERAQTRRAVGDLGIVAAGIETTPAQLSGGNAQKVAFAKWLYGDAKVWLLDEPTAGVDVGAKADLLGLVRRLAADGKAVVVVTSEFEELLAVCSRVLVVRRGRVVAERTAAETSEEELMMLAQGLGTPAVRDAG